MTERNDDWVSCGTRFPRSISHLPKPKGAWACICSFDAVAQERYDRLGDSRVLRVLQPASRTRRKYELHAGSLTARYSKTGMSRSNARTLSPPAKAVSGIPTRGAIFQGAGYSVAQLYHKSPRGAT